MLVAEAEGAQVLFQVWDPDGDTEVGQQLLATLQPAAYVLVLHLAAEELHEADHCGVEWDMFALLSLTQNRSWGIMTEVAGTVPGSEWLPNKHQHITGLTVTTAELLQVG